MQLHGQAAATGLLPHNYMHARSLHRLSVWLRLLMLAAINAWVLRRLPLIRGRAAGTGRAISQPASTPHTAVPGGADACLSVRWLS